MSIKHRIFFYKDKTTGKLLAYIESCSPTPIIIGTVVPSKDGNYFKEIIVGGAADKQDSWWKFVLEALEKGWWIISDEFPFDPKNIEIVSVQV